VFFVPAGVRQSIYRRMRRQKQTRSSRAGIILVVLLLGLAWVWVLNRRVPNSDGDPQWRPQARAADWKCIVIHHSATPSGCAQRFDAAHRRRGWNELGYHFVIGNGTDTADGAVEVGSRWQQQKAGAHCKTPDGFYNQRGIGICLVGDFEKHPPTPAQLASLQRLVRHLCQQWSIAPGNIYSHGQVTGRTACPGRYLNLQVVQQGVSHLPPAAMGTHRDEDPEDE